MWWLWNSDVVWLVGESDGIVNAQWLRMKSDINGNEFDIENGM